jgi:hypothetical protein
MPVDLDTVFDSDFLPADSSPVFTPSPWPRWELDWYHYLLTMNDRSGFDRFVAALADVRGRYDAGRVQADLDAWAVQIHDSVDADPHKWFTMERHQHAIDKSRAYAHDRAVAIDAWLTCRHTGTGLDKDADGYDLCHDCDENQPLVNPGSLEQCNQRDDDCNGQADNMPAGQVRQ